VIGAKTVEFLDCRDGELEHTHAFRGEIVRTIRRVRPEAVFTHDPTTIYGLDMINHPDHIAVGLTTLAAIYPTARDRLQFPQHLALGLQPHKVTQVYMFGSLSPNTWIDISTTFETKVCALKHHVSQVGRRDDLEKRMRERAARLGEAAEVPLAEAFHRVVLSR
jgi:LmbE family N-acetylglucosaminyl deacetylase